jgi:hypothetical protein
VFPAFFVRMRRFAFVLPGLALFAACGGGEAPTGGAAKTPDNDRVEQDKEPGSIEEAKQQLDRAQAQLETRTTSPVEAVQPQVAGGGAGGATAPTPHPVQPTAQETECQRMCRAFASMQRAQAALCRMAGDDDVRCTDAKKVVEDSARRVAHCGCH